MATNGTHPPGSTDGVIRTSQGKPLNDPVVLDYADYHGPNVGHEARHVYQMIAKFVDRRTGRCFPSLETLAVLTEMSRPTVTKWAKFCAVHRMFRMEQREGASGKQYEYFFDHGLASNWEPKLRPEIREPDLLTHYAAQLAAAEARIDELEGRTPLPMSHVYEQEEEEDIDIYMGEDDIDLSPPHSSPPQDVPKANVKPQVTLVFDPTQIPEEWDEKVVQAALERYEGVHIWEEPLKATFFYRRNWGKFLIDVQSWERERAKTGVMRFLCVHCDTEKVEAATVCRGCGGRHCRACGHAAEACMMREIRRGRAEDSNDAPRRE